MTVVYQIIAWDQHTPSAENVLKTFLDQKRANDYLDKVAETCSLEYDFLALVSYEVDEEGKTDD